MRFVITVFPAVITKYSDLPAYPAFDWKNISLGPPDLSYGAEL